MAEPAATTKTTAKTVATATTAGIYCKACGYDLRASGEAGRCPECGRVFSPGDPKTFRRRPFAAPWKRALGRWAKRAALLLLVLAVLLAGVWGWLYRGWKQEQAAAARTRGEYHSVIEEGDARLWLLDRVPGSFVLLHINQLTLPETATDADLLPLRNLPALERLTVNGPITDAGMAQLRNCPRLRELSIYSPRVTDAGLAVLGDLPRLELLNLGGVSLTDAGLARLETLPELQELYLDDTPLTDAGLVHLVPLRKLRRLSLWHTSMTDAGLVHLEKFRTLKYLDLRNTKVTRPGGARLKAALPGCRILGP